jgi:hypothetical protein
MMQQSLIPERPIAPHQARRAGTEGGAQGSKKVHLFLTVFLTFVILTMSATSARGDGEKSFDQLETGASLVINESPISLPALHQSFIDPDFGTTIMKVASPSQIGVGSGVRQDYSKINPFNANNSYAILRAVGDGSWWLYYVNTWTPIRSLAIAQGEPELRWSPTDPNTVYYTDREMFGAYHPSTNTYQVLHTFTQCNYAPGNNYFALTGMNEGNLSNDGRRIAWVCRKSSGQSVIVYEIPTNQILYKSPLTVPFADIDWISISPSRVAIGLSYLI